MTSTTDIEELRREIFKRSEVTYKPHTLDTTPEEVVKIGLDELMQLITKEIKQAKLDLLNELYDEAKTPEQYDTCDVIHDHRIAQMINELNKY